MDIIDLTDDFEEATTSRRHRNRQRRELEPVTLADSDEVASSLIHKTPLRPPNLTISTDPPKSTPRNSNTKKSTKKKNTPSTYSRWRNGQDFEELESNNTPVAEREQKRRQKEAEEKEIGDRIQKLAESVGWKQPHRSDERKTRKNSTATPYLYNQERLVACDICGDKAHIFETTKLKCKHRHCKSCLQQNFLMAINDPDMWPAKCCKALEQELALSTLSEEEFKKFLDVKRVKEEMSSTNCYHCQEIIPRTNVIGDSTAFCSKCESVTCVHCTKAMHEGACLLDPETEKLLNMAQGKRWSKCPKCSNMVERNTGCNSMMCRCGINFCYKCGREMRICSSQGGCHQIAFQSGMWHNQAPHQPMRTNRQMIDGYRERSAREEEQLRLQREEMARQNKEALEKQQVVLDIVALRAKLENKPEKKNGNSPNSKKTPAPPTPVEKTTPSGMEGYKQAFPVLMKAFEESKAQKTPQPQPQPPKPPTLMERYQKSYPALMKDFMPKPATDHITAPQQQIQDPPPERDEGTQLKGKFVISAPDLNPFLPTYDYVGQSIDLTNADDSDLNFYNYFM